MPEEQLVARLATITAQTLGLPPNEVRRLSLAAALHDVGKWRIPHSIVDKPGKLTAAEFEIMKQHTVLGAQMLESIQGELGDMVRTICRYHHEWHDGTGSYWGKRSDELPFFVSIVSICDVFVALTSVRCYKSAWPPEEALAYVRGKAGTQFSAPLVEVFVDLVRHDPKVAALFTNYGEEESN